MGKKVYMSQHFYALDTQNVAINYNSGLKQQNYHLDGKTTFNTVYFKEDTHCERHLFSCLLRITKVIQYH